MKRYPIGITVRDRTELMNKCTNGTSWCCLFSISEGKEEQVSLSIHTIMITCQLGHSFFVYNYSHSSEAYCTWVTGCAAGADAMWSILLPYSCSTDITSSILTCWCLYVDILTASSHGSLPCLAASDSSTEQLNSILEFHRTEHKRIHNTICT